MTAAAGAQALVYRLGLAALLEEPAPATGLDLRVGPDALPAMLADPMWGDCGRHIPLDLSGAATLTVLAFQVALALCLPGRTAAVAAYRTRLEHRLHRPQG